MDNESVRDRLTYIVIGIFAAITIYIVSLPDPEKDAAAKAEAQREMKAETVASKEYARQERVHARMVAHQNEARAQLMAQSDK